MTEMSERPGRFLWLPPGARPPVPLPRRQELVFLLVGTTLLFSGYDLNVYGLALPQIQKDLHIPENMIGATVSLFRIAALPALLLALTADIFGRRRLLLFTVFGEALLTVASSFAQDYNQFVLLQVLTRIFGYCEELLCFVVIAEEVDERVRGWASGTLGAMGATGAGLASLAFAAVTILPYGWRALYFIGGAVLLILAYYRRWLPETKRFEIRKRELAALGSKTRATADAVTRLLREFPGRLTALVVAVFCFGFGIGPATVLMSKYMQSSLHYAPFQVTMTYVGGGLLSVAGSIAAGRLSDRLGRKRVLFSCVLLSGLFFALFYSGINGWEAPASWIFALFGFLSADALMAGVAVEIFPTAYRATVGGIRYFFSVVGGAIGLALESVFYDWFSAHGPAISLPLALIPISLIAILCLPEPARRTLEEISAEPSLSPFGGEGQGVGVSTSP
ncbi:MAG: MFS transporter [Proteobacteria bacterium]|nr:MFS transporter [Pseudomonadota bacterium]